MFKMINNKTVAHALDSLGSLPLYEHETLVYCGRACSCVIPNHHLTFKRKLL